MKIDFEIVEREREKKNAYFIITISHQLVCYFIQKQEIEIEIKIILP